MHTAVIRRVATDSANRFVVTAGDDKLARVWDAASGRLLQTLRPPLGTGHEGKLFGVTISPDGRTVAVAGWTGWDWYGKAEVYLFDRASGALLQRLGDLPDVVFHLDFSRDGRWLAAGLGSQGIRVWSTESWGTPLADSDYAGESYGFSWSRDGRLATASYDGKLRLYSVTPAGLTRLAVRDAPGGKLLFSVAFNPASTKLAVGYRDVPRVDVLDAGTLALDFSPDMSGIGDGGNVQAVAWSADGQTLYAGGLWRKEKHFPVRAWSNGGRGAPRDTATATNSILSLRPARLGGVWLGSYEPSWGRLDASGHWQALGKPPTLDLNQSLRGYFRLADDARRLQFAWKPLLFDLRQHALSEGEDGTLPEPRTTGLPVVDWEDKYTPSLGGRPLPLDQYEWSRSLAVLPDASGLVLGAEWYLRRFDRNAGLVWKRPAPGVTWGVHASADGRVAVAAYGDGTVRWHRTADGEELLALFVHADRKRWVLWTPRGYYDASPGAEGLIGWHLNRGSNAAADFFPAGRFREAFYRPDVIDHVLDTLDGVEALKRADAVRGSRSQPVSVAQVLPPVVDVLSGAELRTQDAEVTVQVQARSAADAPVTAWRVRVNGQLQPEARVSGQNITVKLPPTDSEIQIFAENRHGVSTPALVRVKRDGVTQPVVTASTAGTFQIQPKLYVLAVGVADYQHPDIPKLGLSAKDARDFVAAMRRQQGKLYRAVEVKLLTEAQATRDEIVDGLDWLQKQVTQHDVGMIFLAGHGVNDAALGYTFLPFNTDPDKLKRTAVSMADFRSTLASLTGKAVFFLDTCHAGNVLGSGRRALPNDVSGVVNELASAENGVVVFSSSTGRQFSLEDAAWGNGAFTKALVEGINGAADYQKNGRITHKMLDLYVSGRVKELTGGKQSPVTQAPGGVPDFPLALVR